MNDRDRIGELRKSLPRLRCVESSAATGLTEALDIATGALDEVEKLRSALEGMMKHSCVADTDWDDKNAEDHAYESAALKALGKPNGG